MNPFISPKGQKDSITCSMCVLFICIDTLKNTVCFGSLFFTHLIDFLSEFNYMTGLAKYFV